MTASGSHLTAFSDLLASTGPTFASGKDEFVNEALNQNYVVARFLKGKGTDKVMQGGDVIQDEIMFDESNTFQTVKPNQGVSWTNPQVFTGHSINWSFAMDHMMWVAQEKELNMNPGLDASAVAVQYKRLQTKLEKRVWTSTLKGIESLLFQDPNGAAKYAAMEGNANTDPYSLPAYITEDTTNYHYSGWTNIMGINPAEESGWRNAVRTYDYDDPDDTDGDADGLIDAFDNMILDTEFVTPDFHNEIASPTNMTSFRNFIGCSHGGLNQYKRLLRASNDVLVTKTDAAYNNVKFSGIDLVPITLLNTATIYDSAAGGTSTSELSTAGSNADGYRYWWINANDIHMIFHSEYYFTKQDPFHLGPVGQPLTWVCPIHVWYNLWCSRRRSSGIVAPQ